jgi:hypothetical protein
MNISLGIHHRALFAIFGLGVLVMLGGNAAVAKTLYVDASAGNDATSYAANGPSSPWATIGRAAWGSTSRTAPNASQAAQAGDIVIVRAGTYTTTGTNTRHTPAYNPVNSGSAGNPITFQAEGAVTLRYSSGIGPVVGAYQRNYITWRGFRLDEALAPAASDTGPVVLWETFGSVIEYCEIDGNNSTFGSGELHNGVRINAGGSNIVRHNYIHDFRNTNSGSNASGILIDHSAGGVIEHNEVANSDGVLFIKRNYNAPGRWVIRFNYGRDSVMGIRADQLTRTSPTLEHGVDIYQNLLVNISQSAFMTHHYDGSESYYIRIVNNTINNCGRAFEGSSLTAGAGHVFQNNVVSNCPTGFRSSNAASAWTTSTLDARHNMYRNMSGAAVFLFDTSGQNTLSFSSWQGLGKDTASPVSRLADPLFVNVAGGNFRLQSDSPARNAGIDRLDLNGNGSNTDQITIGAYITGNEVIGRSSTQPIAPQAPGDVTAE